MPCVRQAHRTGVVGFSCHIREHCSTLFTMRLNELLLNELAAGLRALQAHSFARTRTHTLTRKRAESERYRFNSLHFIGFIQLAWPTTFTSDSPSTNERTTGRAPHFSGTFHKSLFGLSSVRCCWLGSNFETHHIGSTVVLWMLRKAGTFLSLYSILAALSSCTKHFRFW